VVKAYQGRAAIVCVRGNHPSARPAEGRRAQRAVDGVSSLKIEFVSADGSTVSFQQDAPEPTKAGYGNGAGIVEITFDAEPDGG